MNREEFINLNPIIFGVQSRYPSFKDAMQVQGEFLKTHQFILNQLTETQAEVVRLRYGLKDGEFLTLSKISERLQLSHERINQIEKSALINLRRPECLKLLLQYTDETYNSSSNHSKPTSLIRREIMCKVDDNILQLLRRIKIEDMPIRLYQANYMRLHEGGIYTCSDLVGHLRASKSSDNLSISSQLYWRLMNIVSELIVDIECGSLIQHQTLLQDNGESNYSNLLLEELELSHATISTLRDAGINTAQDIVDYYNNRGRFILDAKLTLGMHAEIGSRLTLFNISLSERPIMGENPNYYIERMELQFTRRIKTCLNIVGIKTNKDVVEYYNKNGRLSNIPGITINDETCIINELRSYGIMLGTSLRDEVRNPKDILIHELNFSAKIYNVLRRGGLNTLADLVNYYNANNSFTSISGIGEKAEQEIIEKLTELKVLEISRKRNVKIKPSGATV